MLIAPYMFFIIFLVVILVVRPRLATVCCTGHSLIFIDNSSAK